MVGPRRNSGASAIRSSPMLPSTSFIAERQLASARSPASQRPSGASGGGWVGLVLLLVVVGWGLWARGGAFYRLDAAARVDHPDYRLLSPGHPIGHGYGFLATGLVLANLSYLLRRRVASWRLGSMRAWLDIHVATGLMAGLFAISHSALQFRNPLASVTMVALGITLTSGLVGRFIFWFVPHTDRARLEENFRVFEAIRPGLGRAVAESAKAPITAIQGRVTLPKVLWLMPTWSAEARARRRAVRMAFSLYESSCRSELNLLAPKVVETEKLAVNEPRAVAYDHLMRSWRGLHRFFALLMIALMAVHGGVAWYYGYRWVFSEAAAY